MARTQTKSTRPPRNGADVADVLTLSETAAFLRLAEADVQRLVREQGLPGRRVGEDWRFLKAAIEHWLAAPTGPDPGVFWKTHFGALRDDPHLEEIVREAYRRRGRPADGEP
jgi:excisionase family DNA binding protein